MHAFIKSLNSAMTKISLFISVSWMYYLPLRSAKETLWLTGLWQLITIPQSGGFSIVSHPCPVLRFFRLLHSKSYTVQNVNLYSQEWLMSKLSLRNQRIIKRGRKIWTVRFDLMYNQILISVFIEINMRHTTANWQNFFSYLYTYIYIYIYILVTPQRIFLYHRRKINDGYEYSWQ